jgi:hypothetical protein
MALRNNQKFGILPSLEILPFFDELGHGPLVGGVFVVRALCRDSLATRRLLEELRKILYAAAEQQPPTLGRIFY